MTTTTHEDLYKWFLLALAIGISLVFFLMVRGFLVAVLLAGIFAAMMQPLFRRLTALFRGRRRLASLSTILVVLLLVIVPVGAFFGIVASQAVSVSDSVRPWVERQLEQPNELDRLISRLPLGDRLEPYRGILLERMGDITRRLGTFLVNSVANLTKGTVQFLLQLFIMLYAMYFFLIDGRAILDKILYYIPLAPHQEERMVARFVSVTRATIKGTLVIGIVQGTLAGVAFFVAGIGGAAFWGTVMAVLSIIPGVGTALVWIPAAIYLWATGHAVAAILLSVWCIGVVGTVDNVLRPAMVGRDTEMSDLIILLSTLGGLLMFGATGIVIGPIVAALFVTVWDIYGDVFRERLPPLKPTS